MCHMKISINIFPLFSSLEYNEEDENYDEENDYGTEDEEREHTEEEEHGEYDEDDNGESDENNSVAEEVTTYVPEIVDCGPDNGGCDHECKMIDRRISCSCYSGFVLDVFDKRTCRGKKMS